MNTALIPVQQMTMGGGLVETANARDLHEYLESKKVFGSWITDRIRQYDFVENQDYLSFSPNREKGQLGRPAIEYALTLDMAKQLSMVERTEKGKRARRYFIQCEQMAKESYAPKQLSAEYVADKAMLVAKAVKATGVSSGIEYQERFNTLLAIIAPECVKALTFTPTSGPAEMAEGTLTSCLSSRLVAHSSLDHRVKSLCDPKWGQTAGIVVNKCRAYEKREVMAALSRLEKSGDVRAESIKPARGRPTVRYYAN